MAKSFVFFMIYAKIICMETKENLHQGHRQRLLNKLARSRDLLADHELMECLLFFVIPRHDTNPLAHRLLKMFGGLSGVFNASKKELLAVNGIGEKTAELLLLVGEIYQRAVQEKKNSIAYNSNFAVREGLKMEFVNQKLETSLVLFLDKNYKKIFQLSYENRKTNEVEINLNEVAQAFANFHPVYVLLAHNHPTGECYPSPEDDNTTKKLLLLCSVHGAVLLEHAIFKGENGFYGYRNEGRMTDLENQSDIKNFLGIGGHKNVKG